MKLFADVCLPCDMYLFILVIFAVFDIVAGQRQKEFCGCRMLWTRENSSSIAWQPSMLCLPNFILILLADCWSDVSCEAIYHKSCLTLNL